MSLNQEQREGLIAATKLTTVWAAVGITSWAEAAAALAAIYSALLILEWLWKKLVRPYCEWLGWIQRKDEP